MAASLTVGLAILWQPNNNDSVVTGRSRSATRGRGRPPLKPRQRKDTRITLRMSLMDSRLLSKLSKRWGVTSVEALRRCLRTVAQQEKE